MLEEFIPEWDPEDLYPEHRLGLSSENPHHHIENFIAGLSKEQQLEYFLAHKKPNEHIWHGEMPGDIFNWHGRGGLAQNLEFFNYEWPHPSEISYEEFAVYSNQHTKLRHFTKIGVLTHGAITGKFHTFFNCYWDPVRKRIDCHPGSRRAALVRLFKIEKINAFFFNTGGYYVNHVMKDMKICENLNTDLNECEPGAREATKVLPYYNTNRLQIMTRHESAEVFFHELIEQYDLIYNTYFQNKNTKIFVNDKSILKVLSHYHRPLYGFMDMIVDDQNEANIIINIKNNDTVDTRDTILDKIACCLLAVKSYVDDNFEIHIK